MDASFQNGLTALAGGAQVGATKIGTVGGSGAATMNRFTTVASAADSAVLPPANAGLSYIVKNAAAANSMNVFPAAFSQGGQVGGDAINALSANTAFAVAAGKTAMFVCMVNGTWDVLLTA